MPTRTLLLCVFIMLLLAACSPPAEVLPTLAATVEATDEPTPAPTATPLNLQRRELPPTWTPSPDANQAQVPPTVEGQPQATQQQLPTQAPAFVAATPLEVCTAFGEDRERNSRTFVIGESPQVFWTAVAGAGSYSISLIDETGAVLLTDYTVETTFTFDSNLFEQGKLYGWEAFPLDGVGQQMCLGRGAELFPADPLAVTPAS